LYSELILRGPTFYSQEDEDIFFKLLYALPEFEEVTGKGRNLHIKLKEPVSNESIKQMIIICRRWKIEIEPLKIFLRPSNKDFLLWNRCID